MDCKALIALLATIPALAFGQPLTVSELAWPKQNTNVGVVVPCDAFATNSILGVPENGSASFHMLGSGGTFAIVSSPQFGTISSLNTTLGTATYTPNLNYTGQDSLIFSVASGICSTNAVVQIAVYDTNSIIPICFSTTNVGAIDFSSINTCGTWSGPAGSGTDCSSLDSQNFVPPSNGTFCVSSTNPPCSDPVTVSYAFSANGGTYTFASHDNHFSLDGFNPSVTGGIFCTPPSNSVISFSLCNNTATNRNLILFGTLYYGVVTCGGSAGFSANLDVNGSHFTFTGQTEVLDCSTGITCGTPNVAVISNLVVVVAGTSTNLNIHTRRYQPNGATPQNSQVLSVTNFWQP